MNLGRPSYPKYKSKCTDLNVKCRIVTFLEENIGEIYVIFGDEFLNSIPKAHSMNKKVGFY